MVEVNELLKCSSIRDFLFSKKTEAKEFFKERILSNVTHLRTDVVPYNYPHQVCKMRDNLIPIYTLFSV